MGIGTVRGKGNGGEFQSLEEIYTNRARTPQGRDELLKLVASLQSDSTMTTCEALQGMLGAGKLGQSTVEQVNEAWYGKAPTGDGVSQWHQESTVNPSQIQLVNRQAVAYYLTRLVQLAEQNDQTWIEIWGQCVHPDFSIEVRTLKNETGVNYLVVDYRVPLNQGGYDRKASAEFPVYPGSQAHWVADPGLVGVWDELPEGRRFFYAHQNILDGKVTLTPDDVHRAIMNAKAVEESVAVFPNSRTLS
jgi:hypothetical protein